MQKCVKRDIYLLNFQRFVNVRSSALRDDLYFDVGCLLALALVHGGPHVGFFSHALYQCLFNYPANCPLTVRDMTPETTFTHQVRRVSAAPSRPTIAHVTDILNAAVLCKCFQMAAAGSVEELKEAAAESWEYLELAGCNRPISSLEEREALVEDLVSFTMITRMQLPLQRSNQANVFKLTIACRLSWQSFISRWPPQLHSGNVLMLRVCVEDDSQLLPTKLHLCESFYVVAIFCVGKGGLAAAAILT